MTASLLATTLLCIASDACERAGSRCMVAGAEARGGREGAVLKHLGVGRRPAEAGCYRMLVVAAWRCVDGARRMGPLGERR